MPLPHGAGDNTHTAGRRAADAAADPLKAQAMTTTEATKTRKKKAAADPITAAVTKGKPPLKGRDPKAQLDAATKEARKLKAKSNKDKHEKSFTEAFAPFAEKYNFPMPERDFQFLSGRKWKLDFAWPYAKSTRTGKFLMLAVEIHGGTSMRGVKGGHATHDGITNDADKANAAERAGWHLLTFTSKHTYEHMAKTVADWFLANR